LCDNPSRGEAAYPAHGRCTLGWGEYVSFLRKLRIDHIRNEAGNNGKEETRKACQIKEGNLLARNGGDQRPAILPKKTKAQCSGAPRGIKGEMSIAPGLKKKRGSRPTSTPPEAGGPLDFRGADRSIAHWDRTKAKNQKRPLLGVEGVGPYKSRLNDRQGGARGRSC